jgi:dolichol-phosphate mannosyltransferase
MDLSIVVPCYNEADNVPKIQNEFFQVVQELASNRSVEVVFVDDGSTDSTWQALTDSFSNYRQAGITVKIERHPVNKGLGAALRTGFAAARGDIIVSTDSDGTYRFSSIPELLSYLKPGVDIVTASPYHPQGGVAGVPAYRLVLSRGSSTIYRLLVDWNVRTYTCLFRAYRREVIEKARFESNGFLAGTELMVNAMLMGYRVAEYPAVLYSRAFGVSKAKVMRTILAHLGFQRRVLLRRLRLMPRVAPRQATGGQEWA